MGARARRQADLVPPDPITLYKEAVADLMAAARWERASGARRPQSRRTFASSRLAAKKRTSVDAPGAVSSSAACAARSVGLVACSEELRVEGFPNPESKDLGLRGWYIWGWGTAG